MIYAVTVYCYLGHKLKMVVRKCLALPGVEILEARWNSISKSVSQTKGYSDRKYSRLLPLVTLALSGPEEALSGFCPNYLDILSVESVRILVW